MKIPQNHPYTHVGGAHTHTHTHTHSLTMCPSPSLTHPQTHSINSLKNSPWASGKEWQDRLEWSCSHESLVADWCKKAVWTGFLYPSSAPSFSSPVHPSGPQVPYWYWLQVENWEGSPASSGDWSAVTAEIWIQISSRGWGLLNHQWTLRTASTDSWFIF